MYIHKSSEKKTATEREGGIEKGDDCNEREEQRRMLKIDIMRRGDIVRGG